MFIQYNKKQKENRSRVGKSLYGSEWREKLLFFFKSWLNCDMTFINLKINKISFLIKLMIYQTVKIRHYKDYAANSRVVVTSSRWTLTKIRNLNIVELLL